MFREKKLFYLIELVGFFCYCDCLSGLGLMYITVLCTTSEKMVL